MAVTPVGIEFPCLSISGLSASSLPVPFLPVSPIVKEPPPQKIPIPLQLQGFDVCGTHLLSSITVCPLIRVIEPVVALQVKPQPSASKGSSEPVLPLNVDDVLSDCTAVDYRRIGGIRQTDTAA